MTTVATVVDQVRRHVYGTQRAEWNEVGVAVADATVDEWTLGRPTDGIGRGSYLSVDDELVYVWEVDHNQRTAVVQRGMLGSEAASHAAGALIEVNPRFPKPLIVQAMADEIASWPVGLFYTDTVEDTSVDVDNRIIDLGQVSDLLAVLAVWRTARLFEGSWAKAGAWQLQRDVPSDGNVSLMVHGASSRAETWRVVVARPFDVSTFNDDTDLQDVVKIPASCNDIVGYGAAWRLLSTRETARTDRASQASPRTHEEVPPMHITQAARGLQRIRDERLGEETARLSAKWPARVNV